MSAVSEEFRSLVECGPLWTKHDEKFFFQTNPAYASCRVEISTLCNYTRVHAFAGMIMEEMKDKEDPTAVFVTKSLVLYIFWESKTKSKKLRIQITWI